MSENVLGNRLRKLREKRGLSQKEAAKRFGISNFALSRYENGTANPDPDLIARFSEFYEVSTDYLLGRVDDPDLYSIREEAERAVKKRGIPDLEGLTDEQIKLIEQLIEQMKRGK